MCVHLLHHIVSGIKQFGPVYGTWMYSFERFNSWMCRCALNRAYPENTVMETYRVYNLIFYDFTIIVATCISQIFKWCNYMMYSRKDHDSSLVIISSEQTERELMLSYFDNMDEHYKHHLFNTLILYNSTKKKECKRGRKK